MAASTERATGLPALREPVPIVQVIRADDMSDAELGQAAAVAVDQSVASRADSVEQAIRAGELLRAAKERCRAQGRSWSDWCRRYWPKSRRTADTYIAVALEVSHGEFGGRAPNISAALTCPSVRALLTDAGIGAGGTRDRSEPDGMREPGADEGEDEDLSNVPTDPLMREPTERERAEIDRLAREKEDAKERREAERARKRQEQLDRERAERNKREREQDEEQRGPITSPDEMARRLAAQDMVRQEREAIEEARKRPEGPPVLYQPPPPPPRGLYTIQEECEQVATAAEALMRRGCSVEVSDEVHPDAPWRAALADMQTSMTDVLTKWAAVWRQIGRVDAAAVAAMKARRP